MTETLDRLISRKEFAELAEVSISKLHNALRSTEIDTPTPKKKIGFQFLYSLNECLEFLKDNDLKNNAVDGLSYSTASERDFRPINKKMALQFITGLNYETVKTLLDSMQRKCGPRNGRRAGKSTRNKAL